ncbi:hypothetical protein niasHS_015221 [Heterodera schachtii]|uniref:Ionotropic glutamate receptor C-terminal domain-containing protein n=2 Tax=Heterodera TaxID=34509 RepID=A0ABD2I546_HETSC
MAKSLNLSYDIVSMQHEGWGKKGPLGKWNGALGMLAEGEAEILAGGTIMNDERYNIADFTVPVGFQESAVLVRVTEMDVAQVLFSAFHWQLALVLLLLLLISFGAFSFIGKNAESFANGVFSFVAVPTTKSYSPSRFFSFFAHQVRVHPSRHFSSLIVLFTFHLAAFLTLANFCAFLVPLFSFSTMKPKFESMNDITNAVKSGQWTLILDMKTPGRTELLENIIDDPQFLKMFEDSNRVKFVDGLVNGVHFVQNHSGNAMLIGPRGRLHWLASIMCNVKVLPNIVLPAYLSIALRIGSPYRHFLDKRIYSYWDSGYIQRWSRDFDLNALVRSRANQSKCEQSRNKRRRKGILSLTQLANIFLLFLFGLSISSVVFAFEFMAFRSGK